MEFGLLTVIILLVVAALVYAAVHFLLKPDWFLEFAIGFMGFGALALAILLLLAGINIATFNKLSDGESLAYVSFKKLHQQEFQAEVVNVSSGEKQQLTINGDLWQAKLQHVRIFGQSYYRFTDVIGRYYSLEQERSARNNSQRINHQNIGLDLWSLFLNRSVGLISAKEENVAFLAMEDGHTFALQVEGQHIAAKDINTDNGQQ